jgi:protein TonB
MSRRRIVAVVAVSALLLPAPGSPVAGQEEEQAIPLAPIDVTAQYVLTPPEIKSVSKPTYPETARRREEQGTVNLTVKVLADGSVGDVNVRKSSGSRTLDDAAAAEAKAWTFTPARRGPRNVEAWVEIPVKFQLVE